MASRHILTRACLTAGRRSVPAVTTAATESSSFAWTSQHHLRSYHELSFAETGEPIDVLDYKADSSFQDDKPPSSTTLCRAEMLHVPWNPADVNTVQGRYASPYSAGNAPPISNISYHFDSRKVAGSEGWGRVVVGDDRIPKGSLVTVGLPGMGTLRSSLWVPSAALLQVPESLFDKLGPAGSSLFQLGGTALRMLTDFKDLQPGDAVIQNAGNSGVGLMVSQLAAAKGAKVVSVIRRGAKTADEFDEVTEYLQRVGKCALVVAEEDLEDKETVKAFQQQLRELSATNQLPKLALNAVGGPSAQLLLRCLENGGTMVTYGGMSGKGIQICTPQLIFKDLRIAGYWQSRWMVNHTVEEKQQMINSLANAVVVSNVECPPVKVFPLKDVKDALQWQSEQSNSVIRSKLVFACQK